MRWMRAADSRPAAGPDWACSCHRRSGQRSQQSRRRHRRRLFGRLRGSWSGHDTARRYTTTMSIYSNPASSTPAEIDVYVAGLLGLLGDQDPVRVLGDTPGAVARLLETVPAAMAIRAEAPGKWSMRDVVQHMADSELVGGFRLRMVLAHDRPRLTGYDQDLWADRLEYGAVDIHDALEQFTSLRRANARIGRG